MELERDTAGARDRVLLVPHPRVQPNRDLTNEARNGDESGRVSQTAVARLATRLGTSANLELEIRGGLIPEGAELQPVVAVEVAPVVVVFGITTRVEPRNDSLVDGQLLCIFCSGRVPGQEAVHLVKHGLMQPRRRESGEEFGAHRPGGSHGRRPGCLGNGSCFLHRVRHGGSGCRPPRRRRSTWVCIVAQSGVTCCLRGRTHVLIAGHAPAVAHRRLRPALMEDMDHHLERPAVGLQPIHEVSTLFPAGHFSRRRFRWLRNRHAHD